MVTPLQSAGIDPTRIQSQRLQPGSETGPAGAASETATREDVRVSISAEARAAEASTRVAAPTQTAAEPPAPANAALDTDPVQAAVGARRVNVSENAVASPPAAGEGAIAARATATPPDGGGLRASASDSANADRSEATRLYLQNATALPGTPHAAPSGLRTSA